jgi:hypothetical protein
VQKTEPNNNHLQETMPPLNNSYECSFECWNQQLGSRSSFTALPDQPFKPARRQRHVARFREEVTVHDVMALSDFTSNEVQDSWYEAIDYNDFRKDVAITVYLTRSEPHAVDDIKYSPRGAECRIEGILARRHQWKREAKSAVLDEQEYQNESGENNDGMISAVYRRASQAAVCDAIDAAARDQFDAENHQKESDEHDDFNDDWISSISSCSSPSYQYYHQPTDDSSRSYYDESGFDDSWLTA